MNKLIIIAVVIGLIGVASWIWLGRGQAENQPSAKEGLRYVALGDSYTIGEGVPQPDRWPEQLARHLSQTGQPVTVVANPSVTGYTTADVIREELPVLESTEADLVTLQIGVNDWVQGVAENEFRQNLVRLLERITQRAPGRLVVVTIPDFASTPTGGRFTRGRDGTAGIQRFNQIIREEAGKRQIPVADIFGVSQRVRGDTGLVTGDGLHPSAKQYTDWEAAIYPVVKDQLGINR